MCRFAWSTKFLLQQGYFLLGFVCACFELSIVFVCLEFLCFSKNLDHTICCRGATTSLSAPWRTTRWCWWSLDLNNMLSHFKSYLIILHHISLYHNIISQQSPHIYLIISHHMLVQVLVLGALVGLGCAQLLIILFSFCLCRVSWLPSYIVQCPTKNVWFCSISPTKSFKKEKCSEFNSPSVFDKQQRQL